MIHYTTKRLAILLAIVTPQMAIAQRSSGGSTKPFIVRGSGDAAGVRRVQSIAAPAHLTIEQLRQMLGPDVSAFESSWTLTPRSPVAAGGRFSLMFENVQGVYPDGGYANFTGPSAKIIIDVRPIVLNERYLIDCSVLRYADYTFYGPGNTESTFSNTWHLLAIYEPTDTKGGTFKIESTGNVTGMFFSCDISKLQ